MVPNCTHWSITVHFTDASREPYQQVNPLDAGIEHRTEHLTTGFVVDRGKLSGGFRTDSDVMPVDPMQNDFIAPATSGDVHLYLYAVDPRGGFDWTERVIHVQ
jgi:hypothetical protein